MLLTKLLCCSLLFVWGSPTLRTLHVEGVSSATLRNPEVPWLGDPDLSKVDDKRVLQLWDDIVLALRREKGFGGVQGLPFYKEHFPNSLNREEQKYILAMLEVELKKESINWEYVFTMLLIMSAGVEQTSTIPDMANFLFTLPRPLKMSWAHGMSYKTMLFLLGHQYSNVSAKLLYEAMHETYWGDDPLFSPWLSTTSRAESLHRLRSWALSSLTNLPPQISLPWLEKLAQDFPFDNVDKDRLALMYAGVMDTDLFIGKVVNAYLKEIYTQQDRKSVV